MRVKKIKKLLYIFNKYVILFFFLKIPVMESVIKREIYSIIGTFRCNLCLKAFVTCLKVTLHCDKLKIRVCKSFVLKNFGCNLLDSTPIIDIVKYSMLTMLYISTNCVKNLTLSSHS